MTITNTILLLINYYLKDCLSIFFLIGQYLFPVMLNSITIFWQISIAKSTTSPPKWLNRHWVVDLEIDNWACYSLQNYTCTSFQLSEMWSIADSFRSVCKKNCFSSLIWYDNIIFSTLNTDYNMQINTSHRFYILCLFNEKQYY